jgi:hypothetical protein
LRQETIVFFGHGLLVVRKSFDAQNVDTSLWHCHPDYEDFEWSQNLTTEELVAFVQQRLASPEVEASLEQAREHGLTIHFAISRTQRRSSPGKSGSPTS